MLVLSRRPGETLILETSDGYVEVTTKRIDGQQAKVGTTAPPSMRVVREALVEERATGQSVIDAERSFVSRHSPPASSNQTRFVGK